jgi:hypothetical protein
MASMECVNSVPYVHSAQYSVRYTIRTAHPDPIVDLNWPTSHLYDPYSTRKLYRTSICTKPSSLVNLGTVPSWRERDVSQNYTQACFLEPLVSCIFLVRLDREWTSHSACHGARFVRTSLSRRQIVIYPFDTKALSSIRLLSCHRSSAEFSNRLQCVE